MATILAHISVKPDRVSDFEETIRTLFEATHRLEPGCLRYEYWRGAEENFYYCLLSFEDFRAFLTHQTSDHHEAPDFGAMLETIRLEWIDPVDGASSLPPTNRQALADDASEAARSYATRYDVVIADWWSKLRDSAASSNRRRSASTQTP